MIIDFCSSSLESVKIRLSDTFGIKKLKLVHKIIAIKLKWMKLKVERKLIKQTAPHHQSPPFLRTLEATSWVSSYFSKMSLTKDEYKVMLTSFKSSKNRKYILFILSGLIILLIQFLLACSFYSYNYEDTFYTLLKFHKVNKISPLFLVLCAIHVLFSLSFAAFLKLVS